MRRMKGSGVSVTCTWGTAVAGLLGLGAEVAGQPAPCHIDKILAADGVTDDEFGHSVSVSGGVAVVGAAGDDDAGTNSGSVYVYRFNGMAWVAEPKLTASDGAPNDAFGYSVSIDGDVVVVGAWADDDNGDASGSAYIYRFNGTSWVEEDKLTASDGAAGDNFGWSVSIDGDVVVVGALGNDDNGSQSGSAYVYRFNGSDWIEEQNLLASDGGASDNFGYSVSVSGDVAVAGAPGDNEHGGNSGSAYVYRFDGATWLEEDYLIDINGAQFDWFGQSVSVSGDVVVVGAWGDDDNGSSSGSAFVHRYNGSAWPEEEQLLASDGSSSDNFGWSVAVSGDVAVVGARIGDAVVNFSGSAYVFRFHGPAWVEEQKLFASDGAGFDDFGASVSVGSGVSVVGARADDDNGDASGSVYTFGGLSDCNGNGILDCLDIDGGTSPDANANLVPDECECPSDIDGDASVGVTDLLALLAAWGPCSAPCPPDLSGDDEVNVTDLLALLAAWGACP